MLISLHCLTAAVGLAAVAVGQNTTNSTAGAIYKDASASIDARVADLLSRMTLEEKVAQLMQGGMNKFVASCLGTHH